ncbi:hypothetical protein [Actinophytocola oryzae]|uniref:SurA-like protein n=1 Tax=Actinophytocola oryzae TaxID=502181 RepID=A0A4R7V962_9PSEU|nr:hypothetical protein [Actinophytocola oryzae]TDV45447.1 hypothetical protein CLV71_112114 [Actinophytocola oryzae]
MTSVLSRVVAPFAAVAVLVATLSACGTGPSQVNSAVILGDHVISVDEVQSLVDKVVKEPAARSLAQQHKLDLVAREAVSQLIVHDVLGVVAKREGVKVDQDLLSDLRSQNPFDQKLSADSSVPTEQLVPELVYRARGFDAYANDQLLLDALARAHIGRDSASYSLVSIENGDEARDLAEKVAANPGDAASLMRAAAAKAGAEPQINQDTGQTPDGVYLSAPDNSVFVLPASQGASGGSGFQVVQVLSTKTAATMSPDIDLSQVDGSQLPALGRYVLRPYVMGQDLRISPRYGVWNDVTLTVVPKNEADVSGFVVRPTSDKS